MLHTYATAMPDVMGLSARDSALPVVPMFHVNAWSIPYGAAAVGAKLVFPGPKMGDVTAVALHQPQEAVPGVELDDLPPGPADTIEPGALQAAGIPIAVLSPSRALGRGTASGPFRTRSTDISRSACPPHDSGTAVSPANQSRR